MVIKLYTELPEEARLIRAKVFIEEQGFLDEFDETDDAAWHLVAFEDGKPAATCRFFRSKENGAAFVFGRLAVLAPYRGNSIGAAMIKEAEAQARALGGTSLCLHAQCRVSGFYEKQGYQKTGEADEEQGCPHIWMHKALA